MADCIEDFEDRSEFGKLGFGFTSANELEEIDIGPQIEFALTEFDLKYESAKTVKGQIMADLVADHCGPDIDARKQSDKVDGSDQVKTEPDAVEVVPWTMFFDGSSYGNGCGIGLLIISPRGARFEFACPIEKCTNNQAKH